MAKLSIFPGGSSGGFPGPGHRLTDTTRGEVKGWTPGSSRRLVAWLWSVNVDALSRDDGWAVTLTVGETPPSAEEWQACRDKLLRKLRALGVELVHWVVEWTARGRPHLHMAVYGPGRLDAHILSAWLLVVDSMGWPASTKAQHIVPITGTSGWLQYVSKHAARGVAHYQRQGAPPGWEKTGRLWGHSGEWPLEVPIEVELERVQFHRYRRLARAWQRARMRREGVPWKHIKRLGHKYGDKEKGAMMGVSGWIPDAVSLMLVELALDAEVQIDYEKWDTHNVS